MTDKISILIVDDLPATRKNVCEMFQREPDIRVIGEADRGEKAIEIAVENRPDIILMDINMPGVDGIYASKTISELVPHSQIIIMSVQSDSDYLRRAMLAGARDFLTKPFGADELLTAIRRVHEKRPDSSRGRKKTSTSFFQNKELILRILRASEIVKLYANSSKDGHLVEKLARLVASIAHDLRSPLNLIRTTLETIEISENEGIDAYLERIERRVQYCTWIADNFLGISFNENFKSTEFSMLESITDALSLFENRFPDSLYQHIDVSPNLKVYTAERLFQLAFMNLTSNALEAMPDGGELGIYTVERADWIKVVIADTGMGIPDHQVGDLFKIGFTTKPAHCGTGLFVARRLMQQQFGDIKLLKTEIGKGSTFTLMLPRDPIDFVVNFNHSKMQRKLKRLKNILSKHKKLSLTEKQKEEINSSFEAITSRFTRNLGNELAVVESTVKEITNKSSDDSLRQALSRIGHNITYAQLLVRNMAEIGESTTLKLGKVSLIEVIEDVLLLLDRKMPPDLYQVEWDVDLILREIEADETQIKQVFVNLIRNALDAMPDGGKITFRLAQRDEKVILDVSDTGIGISPEDQRKLFRLGFTTKPAGYGIGLFSIKTIISRHNGKIKVASKLGKGTTFRIELPLVQ
jgi:signal transduction histidine kinase